MEEIEKKSELPWVEKYRPKSIKEMAKPVAKVNRQKVDLIDELIKFIKNFKKESKEKAVLLEGPPGIGKTSVIYAIANDLNMQVIETNASDTRTQKSLKRKLDEASKARDMMDFIFKSKNKIILIDEIDGIYGVSDKGAIPTVLEIMINSEFPIVMIANEYKRSLNPIYKKVRKFEVQPLSEEAVIKILEKILKRENINDFKPKDLSSIAQKNNGDLRASINDLQGLMQGGRSAESLKNLDELQRDTSEVIFSLIRSLFTEVKTLIDAKRLLDKSDVDYDLLYRWVNENLPKYINLNDELVDAFENISTADQIFGRIRKYQNWALLPYFFDLFGGGVSLAKKRSYTPKFVKTTFPEIISSRIGRDKLSLAKKIEDVYEISSIEATRTVIPFLKLLSSKSIKIKKEISDWLQLDSKEKQILKN